MNVMNSFGTASTDKRFAQAYPNVEDEAVRIKQYYELKKIEAEALPDEKRRLALQKLDEEYITAISDLAGKILDSDLDYRLKTDEQVAITPSLKRNIEVYKNRLLRKGVIKLEKSKPICVICGKTAESGDLFVMVRGDNSAACLGCCTCDAKLNRYTNLVFID